jgi:oligopeptide transport system ATP-binding protein
MNGDVLIDIKDLTVDYLSSGGVFRPRHRVRVLEDCTFQIFSGETLGIVGESGCGKTTLANSLLLFIKPTSGQVLYEGQDLLTMDKVSLRKKRREMQMLFQNPFSSLDPRMDLLGIISEPIVTHTNMRGAELKARVEALLVEVGLGAEYLRRHPHEMSGGQAQRVALARALALSPKLLILDEPTSALDVSVQAQIVNLLVDLQRQHGLTFMFVSHNLAVVQHVSNRIAVLYLGEIVELASRESICDSPQHPYTQALFASTPLPDPDSMRKRIILQGNVPSPANPPSGCRFHTRCPFVMDKCRIERPPVSWIREGHWARCHLLSAPRAA